MYSYLFSLKYAAWFCIIDLLVVVVVDLLLLLVVVVDGGGGGVWVCVGVGCVDVWVWVGVCVCGFCLLDSVCFYLFLFMVAFHDNTRYFCTLNGLISLKSDHRYAWVQ